MSRFQLLNGEFYSADKSLIHSSNRGFAFGDGFFESIRVSNGKAPFIKLHWQRLQHACSILGITVPNEFDLKSFNAQVLNLASKNGYENARIRFQGFRKGAGKYGPEESVLGWSMICQPMETSHFELNKVGLKAGLCQTHTINPAPQSSFKSTNAIPYILAAIEAKKQGWDDCFLTDTEGFLVEATASNIFLVTGRELLTPNLKNGGVAGVMRKVVKDVALESGFKVKAELLKFEDVLKADECFLTNATRGIQWVGAVGKKRYFKKTSAKLVAHINSQFGLS